MLIGCLVMFVQLKQKLKEVDWQYQEVRAIRRRTERHFEEAQEFSRLADQTQREAQKRLRQITNSLQSLN